MRALRSIKLDSCPITQILEPKKRENPKVLVLVTRLERPVSQASVHVSHVFAYHSETSTFKTHMRTVSASQRRVFFTLKFGTLSL